MSQTTFRSRNVDSQVTKLSEKSFLAISTRFNVSSLIWEMLSLEKLIPIWASWNNGKHTLHLVYFQLKTWLETPISADIVSFLRFDI